MPSAALHLSCGSLGAGGGRAGNLPAGQGKEQRNGDCVKALATAEEQLCWKSKITTGHDLGFMSLLKVSFALAFPG